MAWIRAVGESAARALRAILGEVTWQPPHWLAASAVWTGQRLTQLHTAARGSPRRTAAMAGIGVAAFAAGFALWHWYSTRPQPIEVGFKVTAPAVTCYGCDPPGQPNPLVVQFDASAAPLQRAGHTLEPEEAGIGMSPALAGDWTWDNDRVLRFQPAADWPIGSQVDIKFDRKRFAAPQVRLDRYGFNFTTPVFAARIANTEFHQDPVVAGNKKVVATVNFTHPVDPQSFERHVRLRMFDKVTDTTEKELAEPAYTVVYDKVKLNAFVHSEQLEVPPKAGRLQITVQAGVRAARGGNETSSELHTDVAVPGLNSLKIAAVNLDIVRDERNEPDQVLLINTSFSVREDAMPQKVSAWLLPLQHPDPKVQAQHDRYRRGRPFQWTQANLRPEVLNRNTQLTLTQVPGELEHYEMHSLRYRADPGRQLYVRVAAGLESFGGYVLGDAVERILNVPEFPRELSILNEGSLLSMSGEKTLTLFARNVPAIRIEIGRLLPRQLQHLITQSNGSFANPRFNTWNFDAANLTERFAKTLPLEQIDPGKPQYEALNLGEYLTTDSVDRRGVFMLRVQAWNPDNNRPLQYTGDDWNSAQRSTLADTRLIVLTDLGLVVKRAVDGAQDVFVQSIADGEPLAGVGVDIIGRNGLPVLTQTTDVDGHVHFPELKSFERERQPVLYLAHRGGDSAFLPVAERDRALDFSRFEVGGIHSNADRGALAAYLFSDRGLYRPGEEIRAAAIIRSQDWSRKFAGLPLRLEITDPRGTVIRRETFAPGPAGFGEIRHQTSETSPTGTYTLALLVVRDRNYGDLIGSATVQVRDFQPDRLRMSASFSEQSIEGWVSPDSLSAHIHLENLFGTPAENRRVTARMTLTPAIPGFRSFPDYRFYDPQYAREGFDESLADTTTSSSGEATLDLNLQRFARATYRLHLITQGFEADGGRGVTSEAAQLVSSMPFLVGYKADGDLAYIAKDAPRLVNLIAIDPQAKQTRAEDLQLVRLQARYVSVLMRQSNGTYKYESRRKESTLEETSLTVPATGYSLKLASGEPGDFAYVVRDSQGQQLARIEYQVAGEGNVTRALEKNAELQMVLAKRDYAPGEEIEISMRAPYAGAGLITIERERVHAWQWFKTTTSSTVQRIKLPEGLEGNAYVAVTFVRDPGSDEIYTSPLSYGVQPFSIDVDARRNPVTIEHPAVTKPGETVTFRYSTRHPSRLVLFAVDEGILQVANYPAPDPLGHFFRKRALEVSTTQILDLILPEFRHLGLAAAPGGDAEGLLGKHLNPFRRKGEKPVAYWSGILDADSTVRTTKYTVPDYFNGTLRVFAVAVTDDRIGMHDGRTLVRGDFILSPNAPTTVSPGDEFDVSVGVANNVAGSGSNAQINIAIGTAEGLQVIGDAGQILTIAEGHESSARFRLRANDKLGSAGMTFTARTQGAALNGSGRRQIDLSIRPATPYMTRLQAGVLGKGEREVRMQRQLYPHHRRLEAGISVLPLQFAHGFVSYLADYPYACTEQIVSQGMPAVLLTSRPEFGYVRSGSSTSLDGLIAELRSRQNDAGAYRLWPGSDQIAEFVSLYTQHLLLEAAERGMPIPPDVTANGNQYLQAIAARDGNNLTEERQTAYAIYLLTRQGQRMTAEIGAQRKRLGERYRDQWEQDLTAAWLAAALDLMKQDSDAERLLAPIKFGASTADDIYYDAMTRDALLLFVTARHFPERLAKMPAQVMTALAERVDHGSYHSLSAGTTLLALDAYATATENNTAKLAVAEILSNRQVRPLPLPQSLFPKTAFSEQAKQLRFDNDSALSAYYLIEESGFDLKAPQQAITEGLEVLREYSDAKGAPLTQITMGQQVDVRLKFRSLQNKHIGGVALVDLLPGGFELVVPPQATQTPFVEAGSEEAAPSRSTYQGWQCQICLPSSRASLEYADMREDRVVFYVSALPDMQEIVYRIKATNVGTYTTPPAYGEAMYDRSVVARSAAGKISVERR